MTVAIPSNCPRLCLFTSVFNGQVYKKETQKYKYTIIILYICEFRGDFSFNNIPVDGATWFSHKRAYSHNKKEQTWQQQVTTDARDTDLLIDDARTDTHTSSPHVI